MWAWKDGFSQAKRKVEMGRNVGMRAASLLCLNSSWVQSNMQPASHAPSPITPSFSHTIRSEVHSVPKNSEPEPQNVTLSGNKVFADVIHEGEVLLELGGPQIQWLVTLGKEKRPRRDTGRRPYEDRGRGSSNTPTRTTKGCCNPWKLGRIREESFLRTWGKTQGPAGTFQISDFQLLDQCENTLLSL